MEKAQQAKYIHATYGLSEISATELKNKLGQSLRAAAEHGAAILRHGRPEFVLLPFPAYEKLMEAKDAPLAKLTAEFDGLVARMQTPEAKRAVDDLFSSSPAQLGAAAVAGARKARSSRQRAVRRVGAFAGV